MMPSAVNARGNRMEPAPIYGGLCGFGLGIAMMMFRKRPQVDAWHAERHPLKTRIIDIIELVQFTVFCTGMGFGLQKLVHLLNW